MTIFDFQPNTKKFYIIHSRDPILLLTKKTELKGRAKKCSYKRASPQIRFRHVTANYRKIIGKITSFPNSFHGQGRRQDEAIALSWFWPKIDFSEEKCLGKCLKEHFWASRIKNFLGSMPPDPPLAARAFSARNLPRIVLKSGDGLDGLKVQCNLIVIVSFSPFRH